MKIAIIYDKNVAWTTGEFYLRAFRKLDIEAQHCSVAEAAALSPRSHELYFRVDNGDCSGADIPRNLAPAVFLAIDTHLEHSLKHIRRIAPRYDHVFCIHADGEQQIGAEWLPPACDPEWGNPQYPAQPWDLAFVGNDGGIPRKFILQALRERYANCFIGVAPPEAIMPIYRAAKTAFNYAIRGEINLRAVEAMGAGCALVTSAMPPDALARMGIEDGRHVLQYRDPGAIFGLIEDLLEDERRRTRMAAEAEALVRGRHTYVHRALQVLDSCNRRLGTSFPLPNPPHPGSMA